MNKFSPSLILVATVLAFQGCNQNSQEMDTLRSELAASKQREAKDREERDAELALLRKELEGVKNATKAQEEARKLEEEISKRRDVEIDGAIFIVTKGAENMKLGLVEVSLFEGQEAGQRLEQVRKLLSEKATELRKQAEPLLESIQRLKPLYEAVKREYILQSESVDRAKKDLIRADVDQAKKKLRTIATQTKARWEELDDVISRYLGIYYEFPKLKDSYHDLCFFALDRPLKRVKSDADGKFKIRVPREGTYVLAARASREIGQSTEHYIWIVRLVPEALSETPQIFLSNDNLLAVETRDSTVKQLEIALEYISHEPPGRWLIDLNDP